MDNLFSILCKPTKSSTEKKKKKKREPKPKTSHLTIPETWQLIVRGCDNYNINAYT